MAVALLTKPAAKTESGAPGGGWRAAGGKKGGAKKVGAKPAKPRGKKTPGKKTKGGKGKKGPGGASAGKGGEGGREAAIAAGGKAVGGIPGDLRTKKFKPRPNNPAADPRFKKVKSDVEQKAKTLKKHQPAGQKAGEAAKSAKGPPNEKSAGAKASKVDSMKDVKAEAPPADSFLTVLRAEIDKVMPSTVEESANFMEGGSEADMKGAVGGNVKSQKDAAAGELEAAAEAPPDESGVVVKEVSAIPPDPAAPRPPVNGPGAMPAPADAADVSQDQTKADADTQLKENRLSGKRLENKDARFEAVKAEKGNVVKVADASPGKFRAGEKQVLGKAAVQAGVAGRTGMTALVSVKNKSKTAVKSRQTAQQKQDELRRKAVTDQIEAIYRETQAKVDTNLNALEKDVMAVFDPGSAGAIAAFKSNTNRDIEAYYDDRYSGVFGWTDWIADKFKDAPPRVVQIIKENLALFNKSMDNLAVKVANMVDLRLNKAKKDIDGGQVKIANFVKSLPKDLQKVGKDAEKAMSDRFDQMREGVEAKKNDLAQKLAQKYKEATDQANELAKKIEEENAGAFKKLADAIGAVIKIILEFKDKLLALLRKAADVIEMILDDPIGFLGNLIDAVKLGVNQFVGNIWTHLKAGFMNWLFGSLAGAGIEIPSDLSLVSIFKLVMGVLGITYAKMRAKAVKLLGPTAVAVIEKVVDYVKALITGGPAKLWEQVKADIGDLKSMVIDAIQDWLITTIVKQATIKLLSFFNPAGAFVQAVLAIYNMVVFLIERASQIMAFVEAVINSVSSIASGAIGTAANWIEQSLARMIPLVIGFLARLIGLGGISQKIKEFILKVQTKVDKAIDKAIAKIVGVVKKLFGKMTGKGTGKEKEKEKDDPEKAAKVKAGLKDLHTLSKGYLKDGQISKENAKKVAKAVKSKHKVFKSINVVSGKSSWDYLYKASPEEKEEGDKREEVEVLDASATVDNKSFKGNHYEFSMYVAETATNEKFLFAFVAVPLEPGTKLPKSPPEPSMYVNKSTLRASGAKVVLVLKGSITKFSNLAWKHVLLEYKATFGDVPDQIAGSLAESNKKAFQKAWAKFFWKDGLGTDAAAQAALKLTSYGEARRFIKYLDWTFTLGPLEPKTIEGFSKPVPVPSSISVIAKKLKKRGS